MGGSAKGSTKGRTPSQKSKGGVSANTKPTSKGVSTPKAMV